MPSNTVQTIELQVLGPAVVRRVGDPAAATLLTQPRHIAVLAYLVLARPHGLHARDTLVALLWPQADRLHGRHALRTSLYAIRNALGHDVIVAAGDRSVGVDASHIACDALACEDDLRAGRVEMALERYQGELLRGFHVADAPEFEQWLETERRRLHEVVVSAARDHAVACESHDDLRAAHETMRRLCELEPGDEAAQRHLVHLRGHLDGDTPAPEVSEPQAPITVSHDALDPPVRRHRVSWRAVAVVALLLVAATFGLRNRVPGRRDLATVAGLPARYAADTTLLLRYMRAQALRRAGQDDSALAEFQGLIEDAPAFAPGWAGYAAVLNSFGFVHPTREALERSREAAERAMALDRTLAVPYAVLGAYEQSGRWDYERARRWLDAGLKDHPNDPELIFRLAHWHAYQGRLPEALRLMRRARQLDPLSVWYAREEARLLYHMRRCDEAANAFRAVAAAYRHQPANDYLATYRALRCLGRDDDAASALRSSLLASGDSDLARLLDSSAVASARDSAIRRVWRNRLARDLTERSYASALVPAAHYAELRIADSAMMWLDSALVERSLGVRNVGTDPLFDFVHDDPRFVQFLERVRAVRPAHTLSRAR